MESIHEKIYIENVSQFSEEITINLNNLTNLNKTNKSCSINKVLESQVNEFVNNLIKNPKETEVILDKTTQAQLTPKFIKLSLQIETIYSNSNETTIESNREEIIKIVEKIGLGLENDLELYNANLPISDCGLFAPRSRSTFNRTERGIRIVNEIVNFMFVNKNKVTLFDDGKIAYTKLISKLSKRYIEQYTKEFLATNKYKLFRLLEHNRDNWLSLKNKPLTTTITEPTAMPVEIAPLEELEPFFKYLDSNAVPIDNDWKVEPCMRFTRGALYKDKRMDLCKQVVGPLWIQMLMWSLKSNTQVEHFLLGNNIIGPIGGKAIGEFLLGEHKPHIKTWYVAGNDLNAEGIKWIVDGLESDPDCVNLWLKRNPLKPEGYGHIGRLLKSNKHIQILDLHNTAGFDEGLGYLVEGLKENRVLRHLYLDANGISEKGVDYLVEYFEYLINNNLEGISSLWIGMNTIGDEGVEKLVEVLGRYKHLKRLDLGSTGLTEKSMSAIVKAFSSHPNLIALDLGMYKSTSDMGMITNNIGDEGMRILTELIESNKSIQYFSVMMNGMTSKGIEYLANSIEKSDTLMYCIYNQYGVEISQQLNARIKAKLESNKIKANFTRKLRNLKHGEHIHWIDSIYRNNSK